MIAIVTFHILLAVAIAACGPREPAPESPPVTATTPATATPANAAVTTDTVAEATPVPFITVAPTPTPGPQPVEPYLGIWISYEELGLLPVSGPAWEEVKAAADRDPRPPKLRNQDQANNVLVLAKALVYARTGEIVYREEVIDNLAQAMGTEEKGETLALARNLAAYVIAADLINLPEVDPDLDQEFRTWLREVLTKELDGRTLVGTHEERPNNWGTHAGASRAAVALYLGDTAELARTAEVFKGYLGDRSSYDGFIYGKLYWQADPDNPVGINPVGAVKEGHSIDGALPEEMRRGGKFQWPPAETGYAWEALQGAVVQAELLHRAGYPAWEWEDRAILRAVRFLHGIGWYAEGDDEWQIWLINYAYGTDFSTNDQAEPGKNMGWTQWTHGEYRYANNSTSNGQG